MHATIMARVHTTPTAIVSPSARSPSLPNLKAPFLALCLVMDDPWAEVAARLSLRDQLEQHNADFYRYFAQLSRLRPSAALPDRLEKENRQLHEENESLIQRLNKQTLRIELAEAHSRDQAKSIESHKARAARLQQKVEQLTMEIAEKNRSIQIMSDEHMISRIQQNVMKDTVEKFGDENKRLLQKLLERKDMEAEEMNQQLQHESSH